MVTVARLHHSLYLKYSVYHKRVTREDLICFSRKKWHVFVIITQFDHYTMYTYIAVYKYVQLLC